METGVGAVNANAYKTTGATAVTAFSTNPPWSIVTAHSCCGWQASA